MADILFYLFAAVMLGSAVGVVMAKSPVSSLLFMIATLSAMAATFVLLEAHFLAAIQIVVYAGAIMVLFMFVIMLLNLGHEYQPDIRTGAWAILSFAVMGALAGFLARQFQGATESPLYEVLRGGEAVDAAVEQYGVVGAIARPLYTEYVVPFEITGILLLVAIVGALALAKKRV